MNRSKEVMIWHLVTKVTLTVFQDVYLMKLMKCKWYRVHSKNYILQAASKKGIILCFVAELLYFKESGVLMFMSTRAKCGRFLLWEKNPPRCLSIRTLPCQSLVEEYTAWQLPPNELVLISRSRKPHAVDNYWKAVLDWSGDKRQIAWQCTRSKTAILSAKQLH